MRRIAALAVALAALAAPALAHASPPPIARPDPVTYPVTLDYTTPLPTMQPLAQRSTTASENDLGALAYVKVDDLGGFIPAPVGATALWSGGRNLLVVGDHESQIPLFSQSAGGKVSSYTYAHPPGGPTPPPDNGRRPGVKPPIPPTSENVVPPANQGFGGGGGRGGGGKHTHEGGGTTTTKKRHHHPPPTTTTTTPAPPTTTTAPTMTGTTTTTTPGGGGGGGGGGGPCGGGSCASGACGVPGVAVTSTPAGCTLVINSGAPGDAVQETLTITNTTGAPYTLSVDADGPNDNHLWQDLEMEVYDASGSAPPLPWPPLTSWLGSWHALTTLNAGQSVSYVVVLYLPTSAGNADQGKSAVIAFNWQATG
jgi:hypothetical protein